jgi:DNA-binding GntR family transcriptional regulator
MQVDDVCKFPATECCYKSSSREETTMRNDPDAAALIDPPVVGKWAPARERVYEYVREGILRGRLAGGTFLEEEHVSRAVGVSRTPVREAFQQLQSERLIDLLPRRGAMVRAVTVQELMEVYETRLMIETHAARRLCAARRGPPPLMVDTLAAMKLQAGESSLAHVRLNSVFHRALVAAAGNSVVTALYDSLSSRQERVAMTSTSIEPGRQRVILDEHIALVAALGAHDAEAAVAVLSEHLRPIREIVSRLPGYADETA